MRFCGIWRPATSESSISMIRSPAFTPADLKVFLAEIARHGDLVWYQEPVIREVTAWFTEKLGPVTPVEKRAEKSADKAGTL